MTSNLVTARIPADPSNYTAIRSNFGRLSKITLHHMAGNLSVEALGAMWQNPNRNGSSHYGVNGSAIGGYVSEGDVAWTNGNWASNVQAVTIEIANDTAANGGGAPNWRVSDLTIQTTIKLVADIARRNNLMPLVKGQNLTWHSMHSATACPGPFLLSKMQYIVDEANKINASQVPIQPPAAPPKATTVLEVGAMSAGDVNAFTSLASRLQVGTSKLFNIMFAPLSAGDVGTVKTLAHNLKIDVQELGKAPNNTTILQVGAMSAGDVQQFTALATQLKVDATSLFTIRFTPMSAGDVATVKAEATKLGIPVREI